MNLRKFWSFVLSLSLILSVNCKQIQPVVATEIQAAPTEIHETENTEATETQPTEPEEPPETSAPVTSTEPVTIETQPTEPVNGPSEPINEPSVPPAATEDSTGIILDSTEPKGTEPESTEPDSTKETEVPVTEPIADAGPQDDDLGTVSGQGITFRLFNYSTDINKIPGGTAWRPISSYFTFRNAEMKTGANPAEVHIPNPHVNSEHDQDGFTKSHATVERILDGGYPVLDFSRNADGSVRSDPGIERTTRSLKYLFSSGDYAVTAYSPTNTILQQSGSRYWYDSAANAVDYDIDTRQFRLRSYVERNSKTAAYGRAYGDFLPFTYTGGSVFDKTGSGIPYNVDTADVDYWFGMTMKVNFFQTKGGRLGEENMVFRFSGDDDVWVFVDDVLVLDLGGTHGTVTGSIDFATGEVLQYLSWGGANSSSGAKKNGSSTSFPTSIRACFDAAGKSPNGGWSENGQTFADFSEHTLKFFYLERGGAVANCSLDFRLPTLPDESLTVTKDMVADTETAVRDYIAETMYYDFRVMKADASGNATNEPFLVSGMSYKLLEKGSIVGTGVIGENNSFQLKAGQSAQFTQMLHKGNGVTRYVVEEIMPDALVGQYAGVEYMVSGAGGDIVTEDDPAEPFTTFQTDALSAGETQTVTFRNRVDTSKLGTLKITKLAAPGTQIPPDLFFKFQVSVGDLLLPVGTCYTAGEEHRVVEESGIVFLRAGETAVVEAGILSGTSYAVTELSAAIDGYRATYEGIVTPEGEVVCTPDGASGEFPLAGTVRITVTNADYDFAIPIPISKSVVDYQKSDDFTFITEQVELSDDSWQVIKTLPEQTITVTGPQQTFSQITVGFRSDAEGIFRYRITEKQEAEGYLFDTSVFLVEITVSNEHAEITGIYKDGIPVEEVSFVNRAVTTLTVTKTVSGGSGSIRFPFTAEVFLNGEAFCLPQPAADSGYTVKDNVLSFSLGHGERISIPCIPIGAVVTVTEYGCGDFLVSTELEGADTLQHSGASREIKFSNTNQTLHYINHTGYRLPSTGGPGVILYTVGGAVLSLSAGTAVLYKRFSKVKRKQHPFHG